MSDDALEKWKKKYYNSLDTLEKMEKDWSSMSEMISRSIIRITNATEGLSPNLDDHLKDVRVVLGAGEIDSSKAQRMDALCQSLPKPDPSKVSQAVEVVESDSPDTKPVPAPVEVKKSSSSKDQLGLFTRLLDRVPPPPGKDKKVKQLRKKLTEKNVKVRTAAIKELLLIYGTYQKLSEFAVPVEVEKVDSVDKAEEETAKGGFLNRIFKSAVEEEAAASEETAEEIKGPDVREVLMELIDGLAMPPIFNDRINEFKADLNSPDALEKWFLNSSHKCMTG
ncbi:MAG: hypothetical protein HN790_12125 [Methylococcales bacterium]|nr:hypothetical protein [Methylococcales bacterium]